MPNKGQEPGYVAINTHWDKATPSKVVICGCFRPAENPGVGHSGPEKALRQRQGFCIPGIGGTWRDLESLCFISDQKKAKVFCKGQRVSILGFVGHYNSVAAAQPGSYSTKTAIHRQSCMTVSQWNFRDTQMWISYDSHVLKNIISLLTFFNHLRMQKLFFVCSHTNIGGRLYLVHWL